MNGRIYDPKIGRMLSADIVVQSPGSLQSYNRYSYVMNNPLTLVDPSGFMGSVPFGGMNWSGGGQSPIMQEALASAKVSGSLKLVQAAGEGAMVPVLAAAPTGISQVAAVGLSAHVADLTTTGLREITSGEHANTITHEIAASTAAKLGASPGVANTVGVLVDSAPSIAGGAVISKTASATTAEARVAANAPEAKATSEVKPNVAPASEAESGIAYRYVGSKEASVIESSGTVPNTTRAGDAKDVSLTYEKFDTASDAESALKMGAQDPRGPQSSPTHRVTVDMKDAKLSYGGTGDTGGAVEIRTKQARPAIKIEKLDQDPLERE